MKKSIYIYYKLEQFGYLRRQQRFSLSSFPQHLQDGLKKQIRKECRISIFLLSVLSLFTNRKIRKVILADIREEKFLLNECL